MPTGSCVGCEKEAVSINHHRTERDDDGNKRSVMYGPRCGDCPADKYFVPENEIDFSTREFVIPRTEIDKPEDAADKTPVDKSSWSIDPDTGWPINPDTGTPEDPDA